MYRSALRSTTRALRASSRSAGPVQRRFASTAAKKGTWKGAAVRWGAAGGALYWYNTSPLFAEEPIPQTIAPPPHFSPSDAVTVEAVVEEKRRAAEARNAAALAAAAPAPSPESSEAPVTEGEPKQLEELEEEAGQQAAFNPETGEINWDCPCLGGMAHGPCGEEFKAAFSCFVYSSEEPKGMDCIDKFQHMQDCFRKYPEIYAPELAEDEEYEAEAEAAAIAAAEGAAPPSGDGNGVEAAVKANSAAPVETTGARSSKPEAAKETNTPAATPAQAPKEEARLLQKETEQAPKSAAAPEDVMRPKKAFDATEANDAKVEKKEN